MHTCSRREPSHISPSPGSVGPFSAGQPLPPPQTGPASSPRAWPIWVLCFLKLLLLPQDALFSLLEPSPWEGGTEPPPARHRTVERRAPARRHPVSGPESDSRRRAVWCGGLACDKVGERGPSPSQGRSEQEVSTGLSARSAARQDVLLSRPAAPPACLLPRDASPPPPSLLAPQALALTSGGW